MPSDTPTPLREDAAIEVNRESDVKPATILIVDDAMVNRMVLKDYVLELGHVPITAENGFLALETIEYNKPDVVLLDLTMPGLDGYDVLEILKSSGELMHLPVIIISSNGEEESIARCLRQGADDYITKPFNPVLLEARINACLDKKRWFDQLLDSYVALKQSENARDGLTHMIVHDIRNALMVIVGCAGMELDKLEKNKLDPEQLRANLHHIQDASREMKMLMQDILDISKLENEELSPNLEDFDIVHFCDQLCHRLTAKSEMAGKTLAFRGLAEPLELRTDPTLLSRILQNLISNAIKHTPKGTHIELSIERQPKRVIFHVKDDGEGIERAFFDRIFEKFAQIEVRQQGQNYGTGLGLTFCKMATESLGGQICVASEKDIGTVFSVALPMQTTAE